MAEQLRDGSQGLRVGAAVAAIPNTPSILTRLVLVDDPDHGPVAVWWHLARRNRWRCSRCGPSTAPSCSHVKAAVPAIVSLLIGGEA